MILDFQDIKVHVIGNFAYSTQDFMVIDDTTGENLNHKMICYADDQAGFYRHYKGGIDDGHLYLNLDQETGERIVCEVHRPIRIVPIPGRGTRINRPPSDHAVA